MQQAGDEAAQGDDQGEPDQAQGPSKKRKLDSGGAELTPATDAEYLLRLSPDALKFLSIKKFKGVVFVDIREFYKVRLIWSNPAKVTRNAWQVAHHITSHHPISRATPCP
jgi:hypothetical protein